jgi:hypothetical protein
MRCLVSSHFLVSSFYYILVIKLINNETKTLFSFVFENLGTTIKKNRNKKTKN